MGVVHSANVGLIVKNYYLGLEMFVRLLFDFLNFSLHIRLTNQFK